MMTIQHQEKITCSNSRTADYFDGEELLVVLVIIYEILLHLELYANRSFRLVFVASSSLRKSALGVMVRVPPTALRASVLSIGKAPHLE